jgi:hypothetical protein
MGLFARVYGNCKDCTHVYDRKSMSSRKKISLGARILEG